MAATKPNFFVPTPHLIKFNDPLDPRHAFYRLELVPARVKTDFNPPGSIDLDETKRRGGDIVRPGTPGAGTWTLDGSRATPWIPNEFATDYEFIEFLGDPPVPQSATPFPILSNTGSVLTITGTPTGSEGWIRAKIITLLSNAGFAAGAAYGFVPGCRAMQAVAIEGDTTTSAFVYGVGAIAPNPWVIDKWNEGGGAWEDRQYRYLLIDRNGNLYKITDTAIPAADNQDITATATLTLSPAPGVSVVPVDGPALIVSGEGYFEYNGTFVDPPDQGLASVIMLQVPVPKGATVMETLFLSVQVRSTSYEVNWIGHKSTGSSVKFGMTKRFKAVDVFGNSSDWTKAFIDATPPDLTPPPDPLPSQLVYDAQQQQGELYIRLEDYPQPRDVWRYIWHFVPEGMAIGDVNAIITGGMGIDYAPLYGGNIDVFLSIEDQSGNINPGGNVFMVRLNIDWLDPPDFPDEDEGVTVLDGDPVEDTPGVTYPAVPDFSNLVEPLVSENFDGDPLDLLADPGLVGSAWNPLDGRAVYNDIVLRGTIFADAGVIANLFIDDNNLWGGNANIDNVATAVVINSSTPKIALGASANAITVGGTEPGFIVTGAGEFRVGDSTEFFKFVSGALDIKASTFNLNTSSLVISDLTQTPADLFIKISGADTTIYVGDTITISGAAASAAFIGINAASFNAAGIWMGEEGAAHKFSAGAGAAAQGISWDGVTFEVRDQTGTQVLIANASGVSVAGWIATDTLFQSAAAGSSRLVLDKDLMRMAVVDATNSYDVVMGYLSELPHGTAFGTATSGSTTLLTDTSASFPVQDGGAGSLIGLLIEITAGPGSGQTKTITANTGATISATFSPAVGSGSVYKVKYTSADYGFWAAQGDRLWIDGEVQVSGGDWIIQHDASYKVLDGAGKEIIRLGTDTGEKGLFVYDTAGVAAAKYTSSQIFIGDATYFFKYNVSTDRISWTGVNTSLTEAGQLSVSNILADGGVVAGWELNTDEIRIGDSDSAGGRHIRLRQATSVIGANPHQDSQTKLYGLHLQFHQNSNAGFIVVGDILTDVNGNPSISTPAYNNFMGVQAAQWNNNNVYFQLGFKIVGVVPTTVNIIAGWFFDKEKLTKGTTTLGFSLNTSASNFLVAGAAGFEVYDQTNPKMFIGNSTSYINWNDHPAGALGAANVMQLHGDFTSDATITGGTFQTAGGTGQRIVITDSGTYPNSMQFYDSGNNLVTRIDDSIDGGDSGILIIKSAGNNLSLVGGRVISQSTGANIAITADAQDNLSAFGVEAILGNLDNVSLDSNAGIFRMGIRGLARITNPSSTSTAVGIAGFVGNSGSGAKVGVYGSTVNIVPSILSGDWAGYFDAGDVHISNKLGIGTASPGFQLESAGNIGVKYSVAAADDYLTLYNLNTAQHDVRLTFKSSFTSLSNSSDILAYVAGAPHASGGRLMFFVAQEGSATIVNERMRIAPDGGISMYALLAAAASTDVNINNSRELHSVTSSERFKENIVDSVLDSSKLHSLKLRDFVWGPETEDAGKSDFGLIAEEVFPIIPEVVNLDKDGIPFSFRTQPLLFMTIAELQNVKQSHEIEIAALKQRVVQLEAQVGIA